MFLWKFFYSVANIKTEFYFSSYLFTNLSLYSEMRKVASVCILHNTRQSNKLVKIDSNVQ